MTKLKPSWSKTDIPKEIKVKFWKVMRDNPTHRSFIGYLNKHPTEFPDEIAHYFPLSPQTYKKLKDEIIQMPLEEVDTLPIELQSWILALRPDLEKEQTEQEAKKATATTSGEPYEETPLKQEESLLVHDLSPGTTGVEFLVTNVSNNLLIVDRICVEVMHWEQYDAPLTTGARIIDYKYKVKIKPNFSGEILVRTGKFKYAKGDVDSFSISFISPPGNKYIMRINFYCSDPETGKRFTVSTDKFEIRFHKFADSGETLSTHDAMAQVRKILEAKRKK